MSDMEPGDVFPSWRVLTNAGKRPDPSRMFVALARGVAVWDGPFIVDLQRDDVLTWRLLHGARIAGDGWLKARDTLRFGDVPLNDAHDSLVLFESPTGCALQAPLIAWWNMDTSHGPITVQWPTQGIVRLG